MIEVSMMARVRLTVTERALQPEIGDAVGVVHGIVGEAIEVTWPRSRSYHKAETLEVAT